MASGKAYLSAGNFPAPTNCAQSVSKREQEVSEPDDFVTQTGTERVRDISRTLQCRLDTLLSRLRGEGQAIGSEACPAPSGTINSNLIDSLSELEESHNILSRIENYLF